MTTQEIEREIVTALVRQGLREGYTISVSNGGPGYEIRQSADEAAIMAALFATDDEHLYYHKDGKRVGWVWLVHGNGWCVIADNTDNDAINGLLSDATAVADRHALVEH